MKAKLARREKQGFTLMEMLIVVAIIAILIAVAIATYSSALQKVQTATCQANGRSLKATLYMEYQLDDSDRFTKDGTIALTDAEKKEFTCPSGGTYTATVKDGAITVKCSIAEHNGYDSAAVNTATNELMNSVFNNYTSQMTNPLNADYTGYYDTAKLLDGIDISSLGAGVWQATRNTFTWTTQTYTKSDGTRMNNVPAIQYNKSTGQYTVGTARIRASDSNAPNRIGRIDGSMKANDTYNTYSEALVAYNKLMG